MEVNLLNEIKYKIPQHYSFFVSLEVYFEENFKDNFELVFFTATGTIVGKISDNKNLNFSKIVKLSKSTEKDILRNYPNFLPSDEDYFLIIENAKVYPTALISPQEAYMLYPEVVLFLDQIVAVSVIPK